MSTSSLTGVSEAAATFKLYRKLMSRNRCTPSPAGSLTGLSDKAELLGSAQALALTAGKHGSEKHPRQIGFEWAPNSFSTCCWWHPTRSTLASYPSSISSPHHLFP